MARNARGYDELQYGLQLRDREKMRLAAAKAAALAKAAAEHH